MIKSKGEGTGRHETEHVQDPRVFGGDPDFRSVTNGEGSWNLDEHMKNGAEDDTNRGRVDTKSRREKIDPEDGAEVI